MLIDIRLQLFQAQGVIITQPMNNAFAIIVMFQTAIKLGTIASGQDRHLAGVALRTHSVQGFRQAFGGKRDLFAHVNRCDDQPLTQFHRFNVPNLGGRISRKTWPIAGGLGPLQDRANASDDPKLAERAAGLALFVNDSDALAMAERWYSLAPDSLQARQSLALGLLRQQRIDEAVDHLDAVRTTIAKKDNAEGFATIANVLGQIKDRNVVLQVMAALRERNSESVFAHYYHALAAVGTKNIDQALASLDQALVIDPKWRDAHLLRARLILQEGDTDKAISSLLEAVEAQPDDDELRIGYARMLVAADKLADARVQFELLAERNPNDAESLYALGVLAAESEQYDQAEDYFQRTLALDKRVLDSYFELGKLEEARENYPTAQKWYEQVNDGERYISAQVRAATLAAKQGDFDNMNQRMAELRSANPDDAVSLYIAESDILRGEKRYQGAYDKLNEGLEAFPNDNDLLYSRALAAEKIDLLAVVEQDLRAIIAAEPDNGHALNALGYTLADRTDRYQEALELLERAIKILPEDPAVLDSMGWIKHRLGDNEEALKYLRQAYEINDDPEIVSHLSEVLWQLGQQDEAREVFEKAFEKAPDSDFLLQLKDRFSQ
nr:TPR repeat-containing protein PA4667-like [Nerophis lumbriciformis]